MSSLRARMRCLIAGHEWMPKFGRWEVKGFGSKEVVTGYECVKCGTHKKYGR